MNVLSDIKDQKVNDKRHMYLKNSRENMKVDGLNSINYATLSTMQESLFTKFIVSYNETELSNSKDLVFKTNPPKTKPPKTTNSSSNSTTVASTSVPTSTTLTTYISTLTKTATTTSGTMTTSGTTLFTNATNRAT